MNANKVWIRALATLTVSGRTFHKGKPYAVDARLAQRLVLAEFCELLKGAETDQLPHGRK